MELEIQRLIEHPGVPADDQLRHWAETALAEEGNFMVNIRVVDEAEAWALNKQWRQRDSATNVLSFPADAPAVDGMRILGDVVLCAPVVLREAVEQGKDAAHHWAHLLIHGLLHLLGYDHIDGEHAEQMEAREIELLSRLGISDPYQ
ncbi:MAG: rRNA maturation RNase YbeY [Wenzhouxiangella sp.]|nr:MAG: rRNA maturation RNase YbeY [Wenzhouxiangella sp.]